MVKKMFWAFALLILIAPSLSHALGECREDRQKYCPNAGLDEEKIKQCLKTNYQKLSPPCKQMIDQKIEQKIEQKLEQQGK